MKPHILTLYCLILTLCHPAFSAVKLPRLISDGLVLQRDVNTSVWGWASPNETVTVIFNNTTTSTITNANGNWQITLPSMKAGGPYSMQISASNQITIENILIGDVWLCSGQSNMELPMERVKEKYHDIVTQCHNPYIRQFNIATRYDFQAPQQDLPGGKWEAVDPESILRFTATGYFFARALYERYKVPIGLIKASVGGSPAEAWLSEEALKAFPAHWATAKKFSSNNYVDSIRKKDKTISDEWYARLRQLDKGQAKGETPWYDTLYHASDWPVIKIPGEWDQKELKDIDGVVWYRKEINIPSSMTGKPAKLLLGRIVDRDSVYINGVFVGTTSYQYPPRRYDIPASLLRAGKNTIVIQVINSSGIGGFIKDKPYQLTAAGQTIDLTGEWHYKLGAATAPLPGSTFIQYQPLGLFNGMIAPLLKYAIKGVIWYQGESNTRNPQEYQKLFPALITDWRQKWARGDFPFLYVQLANYMQIKDQPSESMWAETREVQRKTLALPNTGMAVIIDIGEWNDIHPLNKEDVGKRLALAAQKVAYGDKRVVYSGPVYKSMKIKGNKIVLTFTHTGSGLITKDGAPPKYFAIAGADRKFVWAKAEIHGNQITVWSDQVPKPTVVRYAWADNPDKVNLYNKEGLPASPFTTNE